jgi:hypothetical protein
MEFIIQLEHAREEFYLPGRGDIVELTAFYNFLQRFCPKQNIMLCFILAWALREPTYVQAFEAALRQQHDLTVDSIFNCIEILIPLPCVREYTPQLLWNAGWLKPARLMMLDRALDVRRVNSKTLLSNTAIAIERMFGLQPFQHSIFQVRNSTIVHK